MTWLLHSIASAMVGPVALVLIGGGIAMVGLSRLKKSFRRARGNR